MTKTAKFGSNSSYGLRPISLASFVRKNALALGFAFALGGLFGLFISDHMAPRYKYKALIELPKFIVETEKGVEDHPVITSGMLRPLIEYRFSDLNGDSRITVEISSPELIAISATRSSMDEAKQDVGRVVDFVRQQSQKQVQDVQALYARELDVLNSSHSDALPLGERSALGTLKRKTQIQVFLQGGLIHDLRVVADSPANEAPAPIHVWRFVLAGAFGLFFLAFVAMALLQSLFVAQPDHVV